MAYLIGTAGHVDHGKTTLIAALTGIDADRLPEEKARGMTIDLGFAYLDLEGIGRVSIVDVPGHERFIKNMLAGAWGVDIALLCVAADEGVMPQTREHFEILRLLEARSMVAALTKCDLADEETQTLAELDIRDLLRGTPYADAQIMRVSALTGAGLQELKSALADQAGKLGKRPLDEKSWFLPIDRVFTVAGHGTVITGTLARGHVSAGAEGLLMPGSEKLRVRSVQTHGRATERAEAGQRAALNVTGVKKEALHRGQAVGAPAALVETQCVNARLAPVGEIKHGMRVRTHVGSGEFLGKLFLFDAAPGFGQVRFEQPVACAKGQRMVLRRYSPPDLIAGAEIVTPNAKPRRKNDPNVADLLTEAPSSESGVEARILAELDRRPEGVETGAICEALGQTPQELGDAFERLKAGRFALGFAGIWLNHTHYDPIAARVRDAVAALHHDAPQASAIPKSKALERSGLQWPPKSFDRLVAHMAEEGDLQLVGSDLKHPDFMIELSPRQRALLERTVEAMRKAGAVAPSTDELAREAEAPPQAIQEMLRLGVETGRIVRVDEGLFYAKETLDELKERVRSLGGRFTVAQFRDATGSSRKYALPLLQYFDSIHFTRRVGDDRIVMK